MNFKKNSLALFLGAALALCLHSTDVRAQAGAGAGNFDPSNFDPAQFQAQMQKRMMDSYRKQLEVEDDAEWQVIEKHVQQVMDARREVGIGGGAGLLGLGGGLGGATGGNTRGAARLGQALGAFMPKPSPEETALKKARDANAAPAELKTALEKFHDYRASKQAALEKAQADLRKLLSVRQEVSATLAGLL